MAAHRYWRLALLNNGSAGAFAFAELELRTAVGIARSMAGATATADSTYGGVPGSYDPSKAIDGNASTLWSSNSANAPQYFTLDMGTPVDVKEVFLRARNDSYAGQSPVQFRLDYSDDGTTWHPVKLFSAAAWTQGSAQTFDLTTTTGVFQVYRINLLAGAGSYALSEVQLRTAAGTPQLFDGADVSATQTYVGGTTPWYLAQYLVDNTASLWSSNDASAGQSLVFSWPSGQGRSAVELAMTARQDGNYASAPSSFSVDGIGPSGAVTSLGAFTSAPWTQGATQLFALAHPAIRRRSQVFAL